MDLSLRCHSPSEHTASTWQKELLMKCCSLKTVAPGPLDQKMHIRLHLISESYSVRFMTTSIFLKACI